MPHLFVILVLVSLSLAGGGGVETGAGSAPTWADGLMPASVAPWARLVLSLSVFGAIALGAWALNALCVLRLDRRGWVGAVAWSHRVIALTRLAAVGWHLASVFVLGLLGVVWGWVGDLVLVDELIAAAPAFAVLLWTYRLAHPIERRVRDAMMIRMLDEGRPIYAFPGAWRYVVSAARNNLAIMFVPLVMILAWSEALDRALGMTGWFAGEGALASAGPPAIRLAGSVLIFALVPPVMTRVWDTLPIPPGELRDGLERLAREHRVRLRRFLIWRTHGAMLNGAVIGLTPWLRYIVLTDALLESLTEAEVEAVAAHEVAHVKKRHMIWLALAVLGSALLFGEGGALLLDLAGLPETLVVWVSALASLAAVILVLGLVSRRFEWQADAFAARHLSGAHAPAISADGAHAMSSALGRVARLNGMPECRFTWRHGSIATRRRRLRDLVGQAADRMPIDRAVRRVRLLTLLGFVAGVAISVLSYAGL